MNNYAKRINIFCGNYGSGKTEVALNFVRALAAVHPHTAIVDLDVVNPYFRSRERKTELQNQGIRVISSVPGLEMADLPAVSAAVFGVLQDQSCRCVLDVGGDDTGAAVLGGFKSYFNTEEYRLFIVVNCNRPFTGTAEGVIQIVREIERSCKLKAAALVNNTNLGRDSSVDDLFKGNKILEQAGQFLKIPLAFHCLEKSLFTQLQPGDIAQPVFPLERFMLLPWEKG